MFVAGDATQHGLLDGWIRDIPKVLVNGFGPNSVIIGGSVEEKVV